jgi:four helix bundle protein
MRKQLNCDRKIFDKQNIDYSQFIISRKSLTIANSPFKTTFMFLKLKHQKLDVYNFSQSFVLECYKLSKHLPDTEKFGMVSQIRRAALSVHLNIAEGASRKSELERKKFYEISRSSLVEIDAALDIASGLEYLKNYDVSNLGEGMNRCFKILTGLILSRVKNWPLTIHHSL